MVKWWQEGLGFGILMFIIMGVLCPLIDGQEITKKSLLIGFIIWMLGGLIYGFIVGFIIRKKKKSKKNRLTIDH